MAADDAVARLKDAAKLLEQLRETQAKQYELVEDLTALVRGDGRTTGSDIKGVAAHFDVVWGARYTPGQTGRYVWSWTKGQNPTTRGKDAALLKRLLKSLTAEDIKDRMTNYLRNEDPFYVNARHNVGVFAASINSHVGKAAPAKDPTNPWVEVRDVLEGILSKHAFHTWFKPLEFLGETESVIRVGAPNPHVVEWIRKHHAGDIEEARRRLRLMKHVDISSEATGR